MEILRLIAERLQKLLERPDLSFEERERLEQALEKLKEFEKVFSDLPPEDQFVVEDYQIDHREVMDRI